MHRCALCLMMLLFLAAAALRAEDVVPPEQPAAVPAANVAPEGNAGVAENAVPPQAGGYGEAPRAESATFKTSMWLVKADWSQAGDAAQLKEELLAVLKDEPSISPETLQQLPATGPEALFPHEVGLIYTREQTAGLQAWLKARGLLIEVLDFPAPDRPGNHGSLGMRSSRGMPSSLRTMMGAELATTLRRPFESIEPAIPVEPATSSPFVDRGLEWTWTVFQSASDTDFLVLRELAVMEQMRGQDAPVQVGSRDACLVDLNIPENHVAIVSAFPGRSDESFRAAAERKGYRVILAIKDGAASGDGSDADTPPQLRLPDAVIRVEARQMSGMMGRRGESRRDGDPRSGMRGQPGMMGPPSMMGMPGSDPPTGRLASTKVFSLQHAVASDTATLLEQLFGSDGARIAADARTNSVVVTSDHETESRIEALVRFLDKEPQAAKRQDSPPAPDSEVSGDVPAMPRRPAQIQKPKTTADVNRLRQDYEQHEHAAAEIAKQARRQQQDEARLARDRERLEQAVQEAFAARQRLLHAELELLQARIRESERALELRARVQEQIIEKRVEDLLSGDLSEMEQSADKRGAQSVTATPPAPPAMEATSADRLAQVRHGDPQVLSGVWQEVSEAAAAGHWWAGSEFVVLDGRAAFIKDDRVQRMFHLTVMVMNGRTTMQLDSMDEHGGQLKGEFDGQVIRFRQDGTAVEATYRRQSAEVPESSAALVANWASPLLLRGVWTSQEMRGQLVLLDGLAALYEGNTLSRIWKATTRSYGSHELVTFQALDGQASLKAEYYPGIETIHLLMTGDQGLQILPFKQAARLVPDEWAAEMKSRGANATPASTESPTSTLQTKEERIQKRILDLEVERAAKSQSLGASHPAIKHLDQQIQELRQLGSFDPTAPKNASSPAASVGERRLPFDYLQTLRQLEDQPAVAKALKAEYDQQLSAAEADVAIARSEQSSVESDISRMTLLLEKGAISPSELEKAKHRLSRAAAEVQKAEQRLSLFQESRASIFPGEETETREPVEPPQPVTLPSTESLPPTQPPRER